MINPSPPISPVVRNVQSSQQQQQSSTQSFGQTSNQTQQRQLYTPPMQQQQQQQTFHHNNAPPPSPDHSQYANNAWNDGNGGGGYDDFGMTPTGASTSNGNSYEDQYAQQQENEARERTSLLTEYEMARLEYPDEFRTSHDALTPIQVLRDDVERYRFKRRQKTAIMIGGKIFIFVIFGIEKGTEMLPERVFGKFKPKLKGWSESVQYREMKDFENVITRLWIKYTGGTGDLPPELELVFLVCFSAFSYHMSATIVGNIPGATMASIQQQLTQNPHLVNQAVDSLGAQNPRYQSMMNNNNNNNGNNAIVPPGAANELMSQPAPPAFNLGSMLSGLFGGGGGGGENPLQQMLGSMMGGMGGGGGAGMPAMPAMPPMPNNAPQQQPVQQPQPPVYHQQQQTQPQPPVTGLSGNQPPSNTSAEPNLDALLRNMSLTGELPNNNRPTSRHMHTPPPHPQPPRPLDYRQSIMQQQQQPTTSTRRGRGRPSKVPTVRIETLNNATTTQPPPLSLTPLSPPIRDRTQRPLPPNFQTLSSVIQPIDDRTDRHATSVLLRNVDLAFTPPPAAVTA